MYMVSTPLTVGSGVPSPQNIDSWKQYLTSEDYAYLFQYIENIKNGISNDKMIILAGPGRTGKSTLIKNISSYLGDELCRNYPMSGEFIQFI